MSQVRLYLDEDSMRRSLVFALRARNMDVLTAAEANMINREDDDHVATASALGRTCSRTTLLITAFCTSTVFSRIVPIPALS
jgi:hypothetical protein